MGGDLVSGFIVVLKFAGIALSGVFGCLGLLTNYRDKDTGKPTSWGRIALIGIVASALVAAGSQALELVRADISARGQREQIGRQLREIQRAVEPLDNLTFSFWMKVDFNDPAFAAYKARLQTEVKLFLEDPERARARGVRISRSSAEGPEAVEIVMNSPAFPDKANRKERAAYYVLAYPDFDFRVNAKPVPLVAGVWTDKSDFQAAGFNSDHEANLEYDLKTGEAEIEVFRFNSAPKMWESNGRITSSLDLQNAQVIVNIRSIVGTREEDIDREIRRARLGLSMRTIIVGLPRGREFWLRPETLHSTVRDDRGMYVADWLLPQDFQALQ